MGIRVHKSIGYGLVDIQYDEESFGLIDPRIDLEIFKERYEWGHDPEIRSIYQGWLRQNSCDGINLDLWYLNDPAPGRGHRNLQDCVIWNAEFGLGNVLLLQPLACKDWNRNDDAIDYVEETYSRPQGQTDHFETFSQGIHPWTASYMDIRTGEEIKWEKIMHWMRLSNAVAAEPQKFSNSVADLDTFADLAGFENHEDAALHCAPMVPDVIRDFLNFTGLFKDEDTWKQLRPLVYTYWG